MKKYLLLTIVFITLANAIKATPLYGFRVKFKYKNSIFSYADSNLILTQRALDRRTKQGIALDSTDLPILQSYIDQTMITIGGTRIHNTSRWFNQIVVLTFDSSKVQDVLNLPFVESAKLVARYNNGVYKKEDEELDEKWKNIEASITYPEVSKQRNTRGVSSYYGHSWKQINVTETDYLHDLGYRGSGMHIAVLDAGFLGANTNKAFDSLNMQNRLLGIWNYKNDTVNMYSINYAHGMNVLGCMAGIRQDSLNYVGSAPDASYYLYLTEDVFSEQPIEEDNWLSAAERADSLGVDLINSSLGYNEYDAPHGSYTYAGDFDGKKTMVAQAANMAWEKGIFVVNAMGNMGPLPWRYMLTPADADSIYSVGTIDSTLAWGGSSFGPSADGQIKPDGVTRGAYIWLIGANSTLGQSNGSSFASPNLCGGIACFMQSRPSLKVWEVRDILHQISHRYTTPNDTFGYGIPNFRLAYQLALESNNVEYKTDMVNVYPNPSKGNITIWINNTDQGEINIKMFDISGKLLAVKKSNELNKITCNELATHPKGIYFLQIRKGKNYTVSKVILD